MSRIEILFLSQPDIIALGLGMGEIIDLVEAALREHGEGRVEMPPKPGIHPRPEAFIHAMPAYLPRLGAAGLKWIGCFPEGMPPLHAQLGEIVCGKKPGRERADERAMSMCLEMALEDVAVGRRLYDLALERGAGTRLPLA